MPWLHVAARGSIDVRVLPCRQAVQPAGGVRLPVNTSLWVRAGKVVERVGRHLAAWHAQSSVEADSALARFGYGADLGSKKKDLQLVSFGESNLSKIYYSFTTLLLLQSYHRQSQPIVGIALTGPS